MWEEKKQHKTYWKKWGLEGKMSLSNGCMSLLNLFWQRRTDLKAPVIIPLCIEISKQGRASTAPGERLGAEETHVAKTACHAGDPSEHNSYCDNRNLNPPLQTPTPSATFSVCLRIVFRVLMKHKRIFKAFWKGKQWCYLLWTNLRQLEIVDWINIRNNLFNDILQIQMN